MLFIFCTWQEKMRLRVSEICALAKRMFLMFENLDWEECRKETLESRENYVKTGVSKTNLKKIHFRMTKCDSDNGIKPIQLAVTRADDVNTNTMRCNHCNCILWFEWQLHLTADLKLAPVLHHEILKNSQL